MSPESFWGSTLREVVLMIQAYDEKELAELRRIRLIRYDTYCVNTEESKRVSIYEWMPLEGDPTQEDLIEMGRTKEQQIQNDYDSAIEYYKQHGVQF